MKPGSVSARQEYYTTRISSGESAHGDEAEGAKEDGRSEERYEGNEEDREEGWIFVKVSRWATAFRVRGQEEKRKEDKRKRVREIVQ